MWWTAWIARAEPFAYGEMNLMPDEFWRLTPQEFNLKKRGYFRRRRIAREDAAGWVTSLINHYPMRGKGTKTVRVEQLIGLSDEQVKEIEEARKRKGLDKAKAT